MFCAAQGGSLPDFVNNPELSICLEHHFQICGASKNSLVQLIG
jgi:hypothetical protein